MLNGRNSPWPLLRTTLVYLYSLFLSPHIIFISFIMYFLSLVLGFILPLLTLLVAARSVHDSGDHQSHAVRRAISTWMGHWFANPDLKQPVSSRQFFLRPPSCLHLGMLLPCIHRGLRRNWEIKLWINFSLSLSFFFSTAFAIFGITMRLSRNADQCHRTCCKWTWI